MGIIALSDPADVLLYADPLVDYDLRYDLDTPSMAILEAVQFMHKAAYTHVIIQQVCRTSRQSIDCKIRLGKSGLAAERNKGLTADVNSNIVPD